MSIVEIKERLENVLNHDEMTINNPVLAPLKHELDYALMMAAAVADGQNVVSISLKLVIEGCRVDTTGNRKIVFGPKWSVKVTTKNDIYDGSDKLNSYIVEKDEYGQMTAKDFQEEKQIRIDDIQPEDDDE